MARAHLKTKNRGGKKKTYGCCKCSEPIKPGQQYYEWSFRYGGTYRQHESHGAPLPSQLTQSKLSEAYAAIESAETDIANANTPSELAEALQSCIDAIGEVRDGYQESIDNMISPDGVVGQECQEKIDNLESFIEELESAHSSAEGVEWDDSLDHSDEGSEEAGTQNEELEDARSDAENALGSSSF